MRNKVLISDVRETICRNQVLFIVFSCKKVSKAGKAEVSDSNASCVLERFPVVTETAEKEVSEGVESCDLCENVAAKADELYRRIDVLERHIAQKLELLKLKQVQNNG